MNEGTGSQGSAPDVGARYALGEDALYAPGEAVRVAGRVPIGHYRVPTYLRGEGATIESVIEPVAVDNEAEGYGRNAGIRRHDYRLAISLAHVWKDYAGPAADGLQIEVHEPWLERV